MNIQHSSRSDRWFTPPAILALARQVLGDIDLDPASELEANSIVQAKRFFTKKDDGLSVPWVAENVFLNPPGGRAGARSLSALFWAKLINDISSIGHAIFMAFSLEALQTTQRTGHGITKFPFCVPRKRIAFLNPDGTVGASPSHSNVVAYVPGYVDRTALFQEVFHSLGDVVVPKL